MLFQQMSLMTEMTWRLLVWWSLSTKTNVQ